MATFLFTWELGSGLGHMMQMLPMVRELGLRGHRVCCALRDLSSAQSIFGDQPVMLLQAPVKMSARVGHISPPRTLAHILSNVGYRDERELAGLAIAWRTLFEMVRPDVIVFDHSPTAMLASRGLAARRVAIGSGFGIPPDQHPLPNLRPWEPADAAALLRDEQALLDRMNDALALWSQPPLGHVAQIYSDVDDSFLLTFRELDHYPNRPPQVRYRGTWTEPQGAAPIWPGGAGPRIFGYLKPFAALPQLLEHLRALAYPTLLFVPGADPRLVQQFSAPTLKFESQRLDLSAVAVQCDLAIVHGTHGTVFTMLMASKPTLQLPLYLEQGLFGTAVCKMGAGLQPPIQDVQLIGRDLQRMLSSPSFAQAARAFAARHLAFDQLVENEQMVRRLEELAQ
jgi:hypothetical protein